MDQAESILKSINEVLGLRKLAKLLCLFIVRPTFVVELLVTIDDW